jgi:N utilization substance protein A
VQIVDPENKKLEIIVEDTQLSLAIGKKGQNVRLASKLIGWDIDIKSEEEKRRELEEQMTALTSPGTPLAQLQGVGPKTIEKIEAHGITSIEKLADMTPEQLMEIPGIGEKMVEKIYQAVHHFFEGGETEAAPAGTAEEAPPGEAAAKAPEGTPGAEEAQVGEAAQAGEAVPAEAASEEVQAGEAAPAEAASEAAQAGEAAPAEAAPSAEPAAEAAAAETAPSPEPEAGSEAAAPAEEGGPPEEKQE